MNPRLCFSVKVVTGLNISKRLIIRTFLCHTILEQDAPATLSGSSIYALNYKNV